MVVKQKFEIIKLATGKYVVYGTQHMPSGFDAIAGRYSSRGFSKPVTNPGTKAAAAKQLKFLNQMSRRAKNTIIGWGY